MIRSMTTMLIGLLLMTHAFASRAEIERGNVSFESSDYKAAIETYQQVLDDISATEETEIASAPPELLHNLAAAYFKLGDPNSIEEARDLWVRAAALGDAEFEARCRYNLGNIHYLEGFTTQQAGDLNSSKESLKNAIAQYRDAIKLDSGLKEARVNLQLAYQLLKQIKEQEQQQQQQEPDPNSQCENQDPNQQQESNQDQDSNQQNQQNDQQQQESGQDQQSSQPEQQQSQQQEQEQSQEQQQQNNQQSGQPQQEEDEQDAAQEQAAQQQESAENQTQPRQVNLSQQEAQQLLQQVRERELERREALRLRAEAAAAKERKVDRDW